MVKKTDFPPEIARVLLAFGKNMKAGREATGLSQQQLAERSGLSMSVITGVEQGRRTNPTLSTLLAIANTLGMTLDELVGRSRDRAKGK